MHDASVTFSHNTDIVPRYMTDAVVTSVCFFGDIRDSQGRIDTSSPAVKLAINLFNELVSGNLSNIDEAPYYLIRLAGNLNPAVTAVKSLKDSMLRAFEYNELSEITLGIHPLDVHASRYML